MAQLTWSRPSDWNNDSCSTPYIHWWNDKERRVREVPAGSSEEFIDKDFPVDVEAATPAVLTVPIPKHAAHPARGDLRWRSEDTKESLKNVEGLTEDTVIVGVIDTGIALGHSRFRLSGGKTRFIASWQQNARFDPAQPYLRHGQELYAPDINRLLADHSHPDLGGSLDEDAFNRDAQLVQPIEPMGQRDLDHWAAHGAHVTDLAAGYDAAAHSATDVPERLRLIAVNLPPQSVHGSAGNFLTVLADQAVRRILWLSRAAWEAKFPGKSGGFPVVINFSFGRQAGPKDGLSFWEDLFARLIQDYENTTGQPAILVMPAGNSNLSRSNARKMLGPDNTYWEGIPLDPELSVQWRVQPGDHTSNFVEIWAKSLKQPGPNAEVKLNEFDLYVTPPGIAEPLKVPVDSDKQFSDLEDFGRVYGFRSPLSERSNLVVCLSPTERWDSAAPDAPSGLWTITLRYNGTRPQEITFGIQTDQSGGGISGAGRRSYFDHPNYEVYLENGRTRDAYSDVEPAYQSGHLEPWTGYGPVQRKGTHNALATSAHQIVIGGYRISDNLPAPFSATSDGNHRRQNDREKLTAIFPTDDSPSHYGLLAAGAREGSVVAYQGTSMATALATRRISTELLDWVKGVPGAVRPNEAWIRGALAEERRNINGLKVGAGYVDAPDLGRIPRHGNS